MKRIGLWMLALFLSTAAIGAAGVDARLVAAVKSGDQAAVRTLLQHGAPVDAPEIDGTTALHWAARADDLEVAELLLRAGAKPDASNRYGITPLSLAAVNGSATMIEALLSAGADPNASLPKGETVLMTAARTGAVDPLRLLLDHGADVNAREQWLGETALIWAAAEDHRDATQLLIAYGATLDVRSAVSAFPKRKTPLTVLPRGGWTPLMYAARQGAFGTAKVLAIAGADLNLTDPDGTSALVLAIVNAHYDLAAWLIESGADPNVVDAAGMSPLYAAVDMHTLPFVFGLPSQKTDDHLDSLDLAKLLLARGADANAVLKSPLLQRLHTPGDPALGNGATAFMRAARGGDVVTMRLLLEHQADPTPVERNHTTALMIAAGMGWRAGDANLNTRDHGTEQDAIEAVTLCLEHGADIRAANDAGDTALHGAAGRGEASAIVRFLADKGADPSVRNKRGQTALDVALARTGQDGASAVSATTVTALRELTNGGVDSRAGIAK